MRVLYFPLVIAPVLVLVSQFVGPELMSLVFNNHELAALVGAVLITVLISIDGRTNWFEGARFLALYGMIAIAFSTFPNRHQIFQEKVAHVD